MPRSVKDLDLKGKRVFIRVDFNVPIKNGVIGDDTRIRSSLPTIRYALDQGATVILASHLGRPKGKPNPEYSLGPVAKRLSELLDRPVEFAEDSIGDAARKAIEKAAAGGKVVLLENLRFHPEEEKNDSDFARQLAELADVYVNDAFGSAHRAHASTEGIVHHVKEKAAGLLMAAEVEYLGRILEKPGSALRRRARRRQGVRQARGHQEPRAAGRRAPHRRRDGVHLLQGARRCRWDNRSSRRICWTRPGRSSSRPGRGTCASSCRSITSSRRSSRRASRPRRSTSAIRRSATAWGSTSGRRRSRLYRGIIAGAKTVTWNGPMGVFEIDAFARGTIEVAKAVAEVDGITVIGGGDSIAAVAKAGVTDRITHISTGGGASLEFLGGRKLPGVVALG